MEQLNDSTPEPAEEILPPNSTMEDFVDFVKFKAVMMEIESQYLFKASLQELPPFNFANLSFIEGIMAVTSHLVARAYSIGKGDEAPPGWLEAGPADKTNILLAIKSILSADYSPENQHKTWLACMVAFGWTKGVYNAENKTHPHIDLYENLPDKARKTAELVAHTAATIGFVFGHPSVQYVEDGDDASTPVSVSMYDVNSDMPERIDFEPAQE